MLILYLYIFQGGFQVLNTIFQASMYVSIVTTIVPANTTTLIVNVHQCFFNFDIWLKMKVEPTYIY